ncbi:UNVERIFIED_CONTAM: putative enzymatic polyprotein [Sesamum radiatum]|uniref:Enzymatic polyprotein n=1 Tax=Sesamum radiatum TaxID=300843 RepID=A0AAW2S0G9_SESRA
MDLQPSQSNYNEGDMLQTSESLSGFFSRMTVSNKTMERIMRQDSNLSPYDGFRIGGIGKVLNQIGLNQRKHHIIYKVSSGEFAILMELTGNVMEMQLIPKEEILEELSKLREEVAITMKWIYIGTIEVVIKATFKEGIDSEIHLSIMDRKEYIEIPRIFKEFSKVMTPEPVRIPRIGGVDIVIKDHSVLERTLSTRTEFSSRMSFSEDRIIGYKGKEKELIKIFTPQEIRQPVISRYEGMLEIAGHEILITGNNFIQTFAKYIQDNHRNLLIFATHCGSEIQRNFSENPLAWWDRNKIEVTLKVKEECKYEYVRYRPIQMNMEDKKDMQMIIKEHINFGLIEPGVSAYSSPGFLIKMENESKKFIAFSTPHGQYIWNVLPMGLANAPQIFQRKMDNLFKDYFEFMFVYIDDILIGSKNMKDHIKHLEIFSDACHKEGLVLSEKKATIAINKIKFLGILIDKIGIELQDHIVEKIRNFPNVLKDKKHLQSFLRVVNFAGIFIKILRNTKRIFALLKETESSKWKWEEIHTQRVRELKQVCSNLPKLAIPQDKDELVVYTDANDYRWAAVLMKKTTIGEEPCRYTGGLFTEQQAQVWHINEKEFLQFGRLLRNGLYSYLLKNLH